MFLYNTKLLGYCQENLGLALIPSRPEGRDFQRALFMKKYIGVKTIEAEPQACQKDSYNSVVGDPGYKVQYEDGYISWSPKEVFEKAYRSIEGLTFGLAIEALKKGLKVRLPYWGEDVYLTIQFPDEHSKMTHEYIFVTSRFGLVPWVATQIEMLSDNWQVVE